MDCGVLLTVQPIEAYVGDVLYVPPYNSSPLLPLSSQYNYNNLRHLDVELENVLAFIVTEWLLGGMLPIDAASDAGSTSTSFNRIGAPRCVV